MVKEEKQERREVEEEVPELGEEENVKEEVPAEET